MSLHELIGNNGLARYDINGPTRLVIETRGAEIVNNMRIYELIHICLPVHSPEGAGAFSLLLERQKRDIILRHGNWKACRWPNASHCRIVTRSIYRTLVYILIILRLA